MNYVDIMNYSRYAPLFLSNPINNNTPLIQQYIIIYDSIASAADSLSNYQ